MDNISSKEVLRFYFIGIPALCIAFYIISFFLFSLHVFTVKGNGVVIEKYKRRGHAKDADGAPLKSGSLAKLNNGTELNVQGVFGIVKKGDNIEKSKYSFTYKINSKPINALPRLLVANLKMVGVIFIFFSFFFLILYTFKRIKGM